MGFAFHAIENSISPIMRMLFLSAKRAIYLLERKVTLPWLLS